jgi:hypothetical protein
MSGLDADDWPMTDFSWALLGDLDEAQAELLDTIWSLALINDAESKREIHWPLWRDVDQHFFDLKGIEAWDIFQKLPSYHRQGLGPDGPHHGLVPYGLVWRAEGLSGPTPMDTEQVGLTISGLVQLARQKQRNTERFADDLVLIVQSLAQESGRIRRESRCVSESDTQRDLAGYVEGLVPARRDKAFVTPVDAIAQILQKENLGIFRVGDRWVVQLGGTSLRKYLRIETAADYIAEVAKTLVVAGRGPLTHSDTEEEQPLEEPEKTVFIVHGHDEAVRDSIDAFVQKTVVNKVIVLHDEDDDGDTIIEKFERYAKRAACAIVLLTPDDLGRAKDDGELRPRARQNVVFELGYFAGMLGRKNVIALVKDEVEQPSDLSGVLHVRWNGEWKFQLQRRLKKISGVSLKDD